MASSLQRFNNLVSWLADIRTLANEAGNDIDVRVGTLGKSPALHYFYGDVSWDTYHCDVCVDGAVHPRATDRALRQIAHALLAELDCERAMADE